MVTSPRRRVGQILECQTHVLRGLRKEQQSRSSRGSVALLAALSVWATAYRLNSGDILLIIRKPTMARVMRASALLVALIVLAGYWAGAAAKKHKGHEPTPAPYEYSPAAEVLVQQAKAPGADGGSYINAAKHVAPAPQVDQIIQQVQSTSTSGEAANLQAAKEASDSNPHQAG